MKSSAMQDSSNPRCKGPLVRTVSALAAAAIPRGPALPLAFLGCWLGTTGMPLGLAAAEPTQTATPRTLGLNDCFKQALEKNLDLQIERQNPRIREQELRGAFGVYDPSFRLGIKDSRVDSPSIFDPKEQSADTADNRYKLDSSVVSAGIGGKLPTGTLYDLSSQFTRWKALSYPQTTTQDYARHKEYGMGTVLSLTQPLLKNSWIDPERLVIRVGRKQVESSEMALLGKVHQVVHAVQSAYYDLIYAQGVLAIEKNTLVQSQRLLEDVRSRVKSGVLPANEERLFDFNVQSTVAELAGAEKGYRDAVTTLRNLITDDLKDWVGTQISATDGLSEIEEQFNQVESWRDAMNKRPEIRQMQVDLERQDIVLRYDRNQLYPSLDLVGSYGLNGVDASIASSVGQVGRGSQASYSYGVAMSVPLSNRAARSKYRANQEAKQQLMLRLKQLEMQILTEVETAGTQMSATYQRIQPARKAKQLAENVASSEESRIRLAQTSSFNAATARRRLTRAEIDELKAIVDYNKSRADEALAQGEILERNSIVIEAK